MPRPVVPIFWGPRASSRARSIAACDGRISAAFSASFSEAGVTCTPFAPIASISRSSAQGSTTTPLPITESLPGRTTPEGNRLRRYSTLPMTSVWPALWPPWKRTTTSARSQSQSTIFPLPSSPHWAPITATLAILAETFREAESAYGENCLTLEAMPAIETPRLGGGISHGLESRYCYPTLAAQALCRRGIAARGHINPPKPLLRRERAEDRVGVEGEAGRGLALAVSRPIASATAELTAHAARIESEADARVVLETAVLHGIDGDDKAGKRGTQSVGHVDKACPLLRGRRRQIEGLERLEGGRRNPRARQQLAQHLRGPAAHGRHRRGVLVIERCAQTVLLLGVETEGICDCGHERRQRQVDREAFDAKRLQRFGGERHHLEVRCHGIGADELGAHLAHLALGPKLAALHPQHLARVAEPERPGSVPEPRGRDARHLGRHVRAEPDHPLRDRIHQAERLFRHGGAGAAQQVLLELHQRRLDPLITVAFQHRHHGGHHARLDGGLGRQQVAEAEGQQRGVQAVVHGGLRYRDSQGSANENAAVLSSVRQIPAPAAECHQFDRLVTRP